MLEIELGQSLTIYEVTALQSQWLSLPTAAPTACLRGAAVAEVDAAGVQLLVSLHQWLTEKGVAVSVSAPSDALISALQAVGLGPDWLPVMAAPDETAPAHVVG